MNEIDTENYKIECNRFSKSVKMSDCFKCDYLIQMNFSHNYVECGDNIKRDFIPLKEVFKL